MPKPDSLSIPIFKYSTTSTTAHDSTPRAMQSQITPPGFESANRHGTSPSAVDSLKRSRTEEFSGESASPPPKNPRTLSYTGSWAVSASGSSTSSAEATKDRGSTIDKQPTSEPDHLVPRARWHSCTLSSSSPLEPAASTNAMRRHQGGQTNPIPTTLHIDLSDSPTRGTCVRHQCRTTPSETEVLSNLHETLARIPSPDQELIQNSLATFAHSAHPTRALILHGLLTMCCHSQLTLLLDQIEERGLGVVDPFIVLPRELAIRVLQYLDAKQLCGAGRVCKSWKALSEDDTLWKEIYEREFGKRRGGGGGGNGGVSFNRATNTSYASSSSFKSVPAPGISTSSAAQYFLPDRPSQQSEQSSHSPGSDSAFSPSQVWKNTFRKHLTTNRNWEHGHCTELITLEGHTGAVTCLQFLHSTLTLPATPASSAPLPTLLPILVTGSEDCTLRVWDLTTKAQINCLQGHTGPVRALQFDHVKLISGSEDGSVKVWDWRQGRCVRTLVPAPAAGVSKSGEVEGSAAVLCLQFDDEVLVTGSGDGLVRVWDLKTGTVGTLRGHNYGGMTSSGINGGRDQVTAVKLWTRCADRTGDCGDGGDDVPAKKRLFSASTDGSIRLWDLRTKHLLRVFSGHLAQVTCLSVVGGKNGWKLDSTTGPLLLSGSFDNSIRVCSADTGSCVQTLLGHTQAVLALATDGVRVVSSSHDGKMKMWNAGGECVATFVGHRGTVGCLALAEDKIVSGGGDCKVIVWNFSD